ncbi:MAG TPA: hypothetical protein VF144_14695 [Chitinophagaceae bacterium]
MKKMLLCPAAVLLFFFLSGQVSIMKVVGKNSEGYKPGTGIFYSFDIPVNPGENNCVIIELFDFANFNVKNNSGKEPTAYVSVKTGFRHIFNAEGKTGFFIEPQAGYAWATSNKSYLNIQGGLALAIVTGYSLEVGFSGHSLLFGFKYETDLPGRDEQINTIGFRFAFNYSFKGN